MVHACEACFSEFDSRLSAQFQMPVSFNGRTVSLYLTDNSSILLMGSNKETSDVSFKHVLAGASPVNGANLNESVIGTH